MKVGGVLVCWPGGDYGMLGSGELNTARKIGPADS